MWGGPSPNGNQGFHPPGGWGNQQPQGNQPPWMGQGGYQAPRDDHSKNDLRNKVRQCQQSQGIYKGLTDPNNNKAIEIFDELQRQSPMFAVQMSQYPSKFSPGLYQVVTFCGNLPIMYKNVRYDVYTKVTLSPGFPHEYPILSIMNIDAQKFSVTDKYSGYACPDGTFEVVLQSSSNWAYSQQFGVLLAELHQVLGTNFPLYKNHSGQPQYVQKPDLYENRAGIMAVMGPPAGHGGNSFNPPSQNWANNSGEQNQNSNPGPGRQNVAQPARLEPKLERSAKEELGVLSDTLQVDVSGLTEALRAVLTKNEEIKMRESTLKKHESDLERITGTVARDNQALTNYYEQNNDKTLTADVVEKIFYPATHEGKEIAECLSKVRSLEEASKAIFDLYEDDKLQLGFDDMKKVIEKMAKEEYTVKAKLNAYV